MAFPASPVPSWYAVVTTATRDGIFYIASSGGGGGGDPVDPRQATYEADPYNWSFFTSSFGFGAKRRQEGCFVEQTGSSLTELLDRIDSYEAQASGLGVPVSHEWGHVYGHTSGDRSRLLSR